MNHILIKGGLEYKRNAFFEAEFNAALERGGKNKFKLHDSYHNSSDIISLQITNDRLEQNDVEANTGVEAKKKVHINLSQRIFDKKLKLFNSIDNSNVKQGIGMCVLMKDDLNKLSEWLAYHYHNLPLRHLVVAIDPDSVTSPVAILDKWQALTLMDYELWQDQNFITKEKIISRTQRKLDALGPNTSPEDQETTMLLLHRERQLEFILQCSLNFKRNNIQWVAHVDTDEFITFNHLLAEESVIPHKYTEQIYNRRKDLPPTGAMTILDYLKEHKHKKPWANGSCIGMARILFGGNERVTPAELTNAGNTGDFDPNDFDTLRYFTHAQVGNTINAYQKILLDVSQIAEKDFDVSKIFSIHRLWTKKCPRGNHSSKYFAESLLRVQHYLGSWEAYSSRRDSRRNYETFKKKESLLTYGPAYDIQPWLEFFINDIGLETAKQLLSDRLPIGNAGDLRSKSRAANNDKINIENSFDNSCALLFFGLPRQFKDIAFPSIKKHIIDPNKNCKIFIHAYNVKQAVESRDKISNGRVDIEELELLTSTIDTSQVLLETEEDFLDQRNLTYFRQFFPRPSHWSYPASMDNMVRQWHSIAGAWKTMTVFEEKNEIRFNRVGLFRIDLKYDDTINVESTEEVAVVPKLMYKVTRWGGTNDRLFYGIRDAAEIWATNRFGSIKEYLSWQGSNPHYEGKYGLHSEDFLRYLLLHKWGLPIEEKPYCIQRVRSNGEVLEKDCDYIIKETHLNEEKKQKVAIPDTTVPGVVVLGMHRSGTSMLAGLLVEGSSFIIPGKQVIAAGVDSVQNKKGFYEPWHVVRQNDIWLDNNGMSWNRMEPPSLNGLGFKMNLTDAFSVTCGINGCSSLKEMEHLPVVLADFNNRHNIPWVLKDPRLCITLRKWLPLLDGASPAVLFSFRHPMDVASSLIRRTRKTISHLYEGLNLWIWYNRFAIQNSQGMCRVITSNDDIIADPELELTKVLKGLEDCGLPKQNLNITASIDFIDITEQHGHEVENPCMINGTNGKWRLNNYASKDNSLDKRWLEESYYSKAMQLYCDMKNGKAFEQDYNLFPELLGKFPKQDEMK